MIVLPPSQASVVDEPVYACQKDPCCKDRGWVLDPATNTVRECGCDVQGDWRRRGTAAGASDEEIELASGEPLLGQPGASWGVRAAAGIGPYAALVYHDYAGKVVATTTAAVAARSYLTHAGRKLVWCRARAFEDNWAQERQNDEGDKGQSTRQRLLHAGLLVVVGLAWQDLVLDRARLRMGAWTAVLAERRANRQATLITSPREPRFWGDSDLETVKCKDV